MGAFTDFLEKKLLDHGLGVAAYTMPTTVYVGLHAPLVLANAALSGATSIDVNKNDDLGNAFTPVAGDRILVGTQKLEIASVVDNTTFWTLTFANGATLSAAASAGDPVGYAGEASGSMPTELNYTGYGRQVVTFVAATEGNPTTTSNSADVSFPDPDVDGRTGSFAIYDAATLGNRLITETLNAVVAFQAAVVDPLTFSAGTLQVTLD